MACPLLRADCSLTSTGITPLNDLGPGSYHGFTAGLYPGGSNTPPAAHAAAALAIAADQIKPLNASGNPDLVNGRIVMISIGMSNTTQEFATKGPQNFKLRADADPAKNPQLVIVDGAQGGQDAPAWINPTAATWATLNQRLIAAGVTAQQVQVAWLKQALAGPNNYGAFPSHAQALQANLEIIARNLKTNFPNIKITYLSPRTRAYTNIPTALNPEPFAFETGFAAKWTIENQISGAGNLNFDPANGAVVAPLILWGPYIWADGLSPRSDGFTWLCSDLEADFTHPTASGGVPKVASHLLAFFKTDPTTTPWFLKGTVTGQPPQVTAGASVSSGAAPLSVNFTASAIDPDGTIAAYQWTFDDGTFSATQNTAKTFPAPGSYSVHLTVTDNSGNTTLRTLPISVAPAQSSPTPASTPTPSPTTTPPPTPLPSPSESGPPTPTPSPTATATASPTPTATASPAPFDGFDPNANGAIYAVLVQPDGKILLGGDFTTLAPNGGTTVPRNHIARLNPDGSLDAAFNPNADFSVGAFAVQTDGKILVGGSFTSIGGEMRHKFARLDATTGLADSFNPNPDSVVWSITLQADGKILAGGLFDTIGGATRHHLARLDPTTGLADSFDPNVNNYVYTIAVQMDGKILVGGVFTRVGGQTRNSIARLDPTTGLVDSFDPNANHIVDEIAVQPDGRILVGGYFNGIGGQTRFHLARLDPATGMADSFNPNPNNFINTIALQTDGKILVGGRFISIGGQSRNNIARLDPTTGLADSFNPNATSGTSDAPVVEALAAGATSAAIPQTPPTPTVAPTPFPDVLAIAVQSDGKILAGGYFTKLAPNGGTPVVRNRIARLEIDGRVDQTLSLNLMGDAVFATAVQPDGKILIGGDFTSVLGVARNNIARLNSDGTLDLFFNPNANGQVEAIAVQTDGKILIGGVFHSIGGQTRERIARLDPTTGLADSFDPNADSIVWSLAVQTDGKILVGGDFTSIGGVTRSRMARLDPTTGLADSFNPNASNTVFSIAVQTDGKILTSGHFTGIGGATRNRIARLDATTGLADSFNPNATSGVFSIAVQADGKILAGGQFNVFVPPFGNTIGGQARNYIARLDPITGLADSFNPNANGVVYSITVQADGRILASGAFTSIGGQTRSRIARLDPTAGLADLFNPIADDTVFSIAMQADGKILSAGQFTSMGGEPRSLFARLSNDTAALQDLAANQTTITWTRGGSSAQFTRVTFESSNDNANYSFLGNGAATGNNWTLSGLNFPIGQNFYVRARGYYRSGWHNGSESMAESVRNAFIAGPAGTPPPTPTATPTATATATATASPTATPTATGTPAAQPLNLSTRLRVQTGDNAGIAGFIITGTAPKQLLFRGIGPSLAAFGVPDALANPTLDLRRPDGTRIRANNDWQEDPAQATAIQATGLAPQNDLEAAIIETLDPGSYTVILRGMGMTTGVGLVELYDVSQGVASKLANLSTRALVSTGDSIVIAGFTLGGNNNGNRIVARGIGPSLTAFGVSNALADPTLELRDNNGALLASNNDWQDDPAQATELTAAGLAPTNPLESGIAIMLPPGAYTALLAGRNNGTGVVEVYDRGAPP